MNKYQIFAGGRQFIVEADGFEINKDEGTITFYKNEIILGFKVEKFKAGFVLSNIVGFSVIDKEEHENYNS